MYVPDAWVGGRLFEALVSMFDEPPRIISWQLPAASEYNLHDLVDWVRVRTVEFVNHLERSVGEVPLSVFLTPKENRETGRTYHFFCQIDEFFYSTSPVLLVFDADAETLLLLKEIQRVSIFSNFIIFIVPGNTLLFPQDPFSNRRPPLPAAHNPTSQ